MDTIWTDEDEDEFMIDTSKYQITRKLTLGEPEKRISGREYVQRLRNQFLRLNPQPKWAELPDQEDQNALDNLLSSTDPLHHIDKVNSNSDLKAPLPSGKIVIEGLQDANKAMPANKEISALHFHPSSQLLLVGSRDNSMNIFNINGLDNPHYHTIRFQQAPISSASFTPDGKSILAVSEQKRNYFLFDIEAMETQKIQTSTEILFGRRELVLDQMIVPPFNNCNYYAFLGSEGHILLYSLRSHIQVADMKINGQVYCGCFDPSGTYLFCGGSEGRVSMFDIRGSSGGVSRCIENWEGSSGLGVEIISIDCSANGQFLAVGTTQGNVTLHMLNGTGHASSNRPPVLRDFDNLQTRVDNLVFHPSSELFAMASSTIASKANQPGGHLTLRLAHIDTLAVFQNWPSARTPLGRVTKLAFSNSGGFFAVGNAAGRVLLHRLAHYS